MPKIKANFSEGGIFDTPTFLKDPIFDLVEFSTRQAAYKSLSLDTLFRRLQKASLLSKS
jgi:hypothetical protein